MTLYHRTTALSPLVSFIRARNCRSRLSYPRRRPSSFPNYRAHLLHSQTTHLAYCNRNYEARSRILGSVRTARMLSHAWRINGSGGARPEYFGSSVRCRPIHSVVYSLVLSPFLFTHRLVLHDIDVVVNPSTSLSILYGQYTCLSTSALVAGGMRLNRSPCSSQ